jgi:hypothetical protein
MSLKTLLNKNIVNYHLIVIVLTIEYRGWRYQHEDIGSILEITLCFLIVKITEIMGKVRDEHHVVSDFCA